MSNEKTENTATTILAAQVAFIVMPLFGIGALLVQGWAATILWGWFAVPYGWPVIGVLHAAGLLLLIKFVCPVTSTMGLAKDPKWSSAKEIGSSIIGGCILKPLMTLLVGWILHRLMVG